MKVCPKCGTSHSNTGKFCSRKCANSRVFSKDSIEKKRTANKNYYTALSDDLKRKRIEHLQEINPSIAVGPFTKIKLSHCSHCGKEYWMNNANGGFSTTCSDECFLAVKRKNRAGSKTIYNGEVYDSKWESTLAEWFDDTNIIYIRPKQSIPWIDSTGKQRKYFPDFYLPTIDLYVDPKNKFCIRDQKEKLDYVSQTINLVYGEVEFIKETITSMMK